MLMFGCLAALFLALKPEIQLEHSRNKNKPLNLLYICIPEGRKLFKFHQRRTLWLLLYLMIVVVSSLDSLLLKQAGENPREFFPHHHHDHRF